MNINEFQTFTQKQKTIKGEKVRDLKIRKIVLMTASKYFWTELQEGLAQVETHK